MSVRSGQSVTKEFTTRRADTAQAQNADSLPTGTLFVNGTADAAVVTVTNQTTGRYKAAVTLPTLAFFDVVELLITATVSSVTDSAVVWYDTKDNALSASGVADVNVIQSSGATVYNKDGTLAAVTAGTDITFPTLAADGTTVPDGTNLEWLVLQLVGGTGLNQLLLTTTRTGTRKVGFLAAATPTNPSTDTDYVVLGSWRANAEYVGDSSAAALAMAAAWAGLETGTAVAGGASSITLRAGASAVSGTYINQAVYLMSGVGAGQTNRITAYNGGTKVATVETAWVTQPTSSSVYVILGRVE